MIENKIKAETKDLTDKDFYQQACSYFYYHAEQRTTMINYFIAVFGACVALYGSLITTQPLASFLISGFLLIISILFYAIDIRNRFDVKQSQCVITQIERDYNMDLLRDKNADYAYGVFSNEDNIFKYYGLEKRLSQSNTEYRRLRRLYKLIKFLKFIRVKKSSVQTMEKEFLHKVECYLADEKTISKNEFISSMNNGSILSLSRSIKFMYYLCIIMSIGGMFFALNMSGVISFIKFGM